MILRICPEICIRLCFRFGADEREMDFRFYNDAARSSYFFFYLKNYTKRSYSVLPFSGSESVWCTLKE